MDNKIIFEDIKDDLVGALKKVITRLPKGEYSLIAGFSWMTVGSLGSLENIPLVCLIEKTSGLVYQFSIKSLLPNIDPTALTIESGNTDV
jgi:hypothetical protein